MRFFTYMLATTLLALQQAQADMPEVLKGQMQCEVKQLSVSEASEGGVKIFSGFSDGLRVGDRFPLTYLYFEHINFHTKENNHNNVGNGNGDNIRHHFQILSGQDHILDAKKEIEDPSPDIDTAYPLKESEVVFYGNDYRRLIKTKKLGLSFPDILEATRNAVSISGDGTNLVLQRYFKNDWMLVFTDSSGISSNEPLLLTSMIANCIHLSKPTIEEIIERIFNIPLPPHFDYAQKGIYSNKYIHEPNLSIWED